MAPAGSTGARLLIAFHGCAFFVLMVVLLHVDGDMAVLQPRTQMNAVGALGWLSSCVLLVSHGPLPYSQCALLALLAAGLYVAFLQSTSAADAVGVPAPLVLLYAVYHLAALTMHTNRAGSVLGQRKLA